MIFTPFNSHLFTPTENSHLFTLFTVNLNKDVVLAVL